MEFTVSNLLILFSVFMIVSNINEAVEAEIQIPIVLECAFVIHGFHIMPLLWRKWRSSLDWDYNDLLKTHMLAFIYLVIFCNDWKSSSSVDSTNLRSSTFCKLLKMMGEITGLVILQTVFKFSYKSKLETEERAKKLKSNIGNGLGRLFFQFLENVIKGKDEHPSHPEQLRRYRRDERLLEETWICPRVIILFPEGNYPYQNQDGKVWGSREDLLAKDKNTKDHNSRNLMSVFADVIKYEYQVSGGTKRKSNLEIIKIKQDRRYKYAVVVENRPLITLCKMVDCPVSVKGSTAAAEILLSKEEFKIQFQVYMRELKRLLDADPDCKDKDGNALYEIVHYKECDQRPFSDVLLDCLDKIQREQGEHSGDSELEPNEAKISIESAGEGQVRPDTGNSEKKNN